MTKLVLDTNIWIDLTKFNFHDLLEKLKEFCENEEFEIVINDIIVKEWNRNRNNTVKYLTDSIKNEYKTALNLSNYMPEKQRNDYRSLLSLYNEEKTRIIGAEEKVKEIEDFMFSCTLIKVTEEQKLFVSNLAIEKQAPFHKNKNNFNDALIMRNIAEYAKNEFPFNYDIIFVTNNTNDFVDEKTKQIYSDLVFGLENIRIKNVSKLGEALKLAPEVITDFESWLDNELDKEAMYQLDIIRGK
jgi:predicted nucleic acid-binding protein